MLLKPMSRFMLGDAQKHQDGYIAIDDKSFAQSWERWVMLLVFSLVAMSNAFMFMSISPIASLAAVVYDTSLELVNWTAQGVYLGFMLALPFMLYFSRKLGLRGTLVLSAVLNAAGATLRIVPSESIEWVVGGSIVIGFACAFLLGIPTWLSTHWFPENEHMIATSIGTLATQLGLFAGYVTPPLVVTEENAHTALPWMLISSSFASILIVFIVMLLFEDGQHDEDDEAFEMSDSNGWFLMLFAALQFGAATGLCWTLAVVLEEALATYYPITSIAVLGSTFFVGGIFSMVGAGMILDRFEVPPYKAFLVVCHAISTVLLTIFYYLAERPGCFLLLAVVLTALGMTMSAVQPVYLMLVVELTSPLPEEVSGSVMYFMAMLISFLLPFLLLYGVTFSLRTFIGVAIAVTVAAFVLPDGHRPRRKGSAWSRSSFQDD